MTDFTKFYINGEWVAPVEPKPFDVINPATEEPAAQINLGSARDVDRAVASAKANPGGIIARIELQSSFKQPFSFVGHPLAQRGIILGTQIFQK